MDERRLQVFLAVAGELNFSRAARRLHLSQSAVSQQVAALERELGAPLFDRTRRRTLLTAAGAAFLDPARRALADLTAARAAVAAADGAVEGDVAIAASLTVGSYVLPPALARLLGRYPGVRPLVTIENTRRVVDALDSGAIDVGFVEGSVDEAAVTLLPIGRDELVLVAARGHRFERLTEVPLGDLMAEPFVLRERGSGTRQVAEAHLRAAGFEPEALRVVAELSGIEAIKSTVETGVGVSIISGSTIRKELRLGTLIARPLAGLSIEREISAALPADRATAPAVRELLRFLREPPRS